ncbi:MAG TPA: flagellar export chaperone FlgN [Rhizobacter sp.]|jgi:flagella synthesis protein FlgN|nr:flagellar export chaperone FlgN [Rhizobacter sp.]
MTPRQRLAELARGMQADIDGYAALHGLLERQFQAALRHDTDGMREVADAISAQVNLLEGRRIERVGHVKALLPEAAQPSVSELLKRVSGPLRLQMASMWSRLEEQVRECKVHNARNCRLIMEQGELMRRVLVGEDAIYAPA